jgi:hypothetical protein
MMHHATKSTGAIPARGRIKSFAQLVWVYLTPQSLAAVNYVRQPLKCLARVERLSPHDRQCSEPQGAQQLDRTPNPEGLWGSVLEDARFTVGAAERWLLSPRLQRNADIFASTRSDPNPLHVTEATRMHRPWGGGAPSVSRACMTTEARRRRAAAGWVRLGRMRLSTR